ncbi:MAG: N-acetyltransferase [Elusimicrobiota bacterium]|jgi:putative acetyltransferase
MMIVRPEKSEEVPLVEGILRDAYGRDQELKALDSLRRTQDFLPQLSLVADEDGALRGYALFAKAAVETSSQVFSAAALILLAVPKEYRHKGIGERLIRHGGERCRGIDREILFALGDPAYFARIGFKPASDCGLTFSWPQQQSPLLVFAQAALLSKLGSGTVHFPQAFQKLLSPQ